ncbi:MAG: hypothetical protein V8R80_07135 [Eubacterium sp.]
MALLLVRIDEVASLPLNEFYDYNGKCYAFAGDREKSGDTGFPLEDFYEGTVGTGGAECYSCVFCGCI